jgi:two-component system sensor histidine kinase EvgS
LTGGDAALTASMLSDFIATSRDDLRALDEAAATRDHEQLRRQAHRIAGAGRIVGAGELAALAKQIENAGAEESGDWAGIHSLVERLGAALAKIAETVPA